MYILNRKKEYDVVIVGSGAGGGMATKVLSDNRKMLDEMAQMLIERETIDSEDIEQLINRSDVKVANYL